MYEVIPSVFFALFRLITPFPKLGAVRPLPFLFLYFVLFFSHVF